MGHIIGPLDYASSSLCMHECVVPINPKNVYATIKSPTYLILSPIFSTSNHPGSSPPVSLQVINYSLSPIPRFCVLKMMSIDVQFTWKRPMMKETPFLPNYQSMSNLLLLPVSFDAKPHIKFARFCTQIATPSTTPPDRAVATEFLINKCGLTAEDITKAFRHRSSLLNKSSHNLEEVLELLNGCGLTTPDQIRKVVLCNPRFFFYRSERNIKSKLSFFRTFMKEEDIAKLVITNARIFNDREDKLKSAISLLQRLGVEGDALSELVARQPRLLMTSEENVLESFKQAEDLGIKKGTKMFATAMRAILGVGKEKLDQRLQCLSSLGFSDKQISDLSRRQPWILGVSKEKLKRNLGFLVNSVGLLLDDLVKYPSLLGYSLKTRIIPRYRVIHFPWYS